MTTDDGELISALLDREPVDAAALARVLEDPDARRTLVAFAALRTGAQLPAPGEAEWLARGAPPGPGSRVGWRPLAAAAALVAAVVAGMYVERQRTREGPPQPARVVQLDPCVPTGGGACVG